MWVFDWLATLIGENPMISPVFFISAGLLIAAAIVGFFCRDRGLFFAFAAMIAGGATIVFMAAEKPLSVLLPCVAGLCFMTAAVYVLLTCALIVRAVILRRKKRRMEILRKVQYTLPEKDNSYVRTRLNTALNTPNTSPATASTPVHRAEMAGREEGNRENFRVEHARKLLAKLQEAPLTKAERLEMEEVSRLFAAYLKKSRWTVQDVRLINDMFSYLLKISAKYAV